MVSFQFYSLGFIIVYCILLFSVLRMRDKNFTIDNINVQIAILIISLTSWFGLSFIVVKGISDLTNKNR